MNAYSVFDCLIKIFDFSTPSLDEHCAWIAIYLGYSLVLIAVFFLGYMIIPSKPKNSTRYSSEDVPNE